MAAGDLAEVVLLSEDDQNSSRYINTFGFKALTSGATRAGLATAFHDAVVKTADGGIFRLLSQHVSSAELEVIDVVPKTGATVISTYTRVAGANTSGDMLPPQDAMVVSWRTGLAGRSFRGRTYLVGLDETNQNHGRIASGMMTLIAAFVTQMLAVFGPSGSNTDWQFVVISRFNAKVKRATPIGTPVTDATTSDILRSQRRRQIGVGG